jgi:2'-5' RNA ligase
MAGAFVRCFVAIPVAKPVRKRILVLAEKLRRARADVKWVKEENLHVTLKFLGWIIPSRIESIRESLTLLASRHPTFMLRYAGLGTFPERGTPRVVWAGCSGDVEALASLSLACEWAAKKIGLPRERRPFMPHVTLGRLSSSRNSSRLVAVLERHRDVTFGTDRVSEMILFRSVLRSSGPTYHPMARFPLGKKVQGGKVMELIIFMGLQASGKTTFYRERFRGSHAHVSKDNFRHHRNPERRQRELIEKAFRAGQSVVVDNTNVTKAARAPLVELGRAWGARISGYLFESDLGECVERNRLRTGKARVPDVALYATAKRFEAPSRQEGFHELFVLRRSGTGKVTVVPAE